MFLVFGSNPLALRLSRWCAQRQRCVLIGLAASLPETEPIDQCDIVALPGPTAWFHQPFLVAPSWTPAT